MSVTPDQNWSYAVDAIQLFMQENADSTNIPFDSITIRDTGSNKFIISVEYKKEYDIGDLEYFHNTKVTND